jgi:hypothetical protein
MSSIEDVRKLFQDVIAPDLKAISSRLDGMEKIFDLRFQQLNERFDSLTRELNLEKKVEALQRRVEQQETKQ